MSAKIMTMAEVVEALVELAGRAVEIDSQDGDLTEIETGLDALDEVLGPDPSRARGSR
jgi:hypothetical protein